MAQLVALTHGRWFRLLVGSLVGTLAALATGARALAQESAVDAPAIGGGVSGYDTGDWLNLAVRLALVLLVIWVAIAGMRWWVRRVNGDGGSSSGRMLQVLESRSLGPNRSLQLVKLGNRAVLLGVTNERINAVLEVTDPVEIERLATPPEANEPASFRDALSRLGSLTRRKPARRGETVMASQPAPRPAVVAADPSANRLPPRQAMAPAPVKQRGRWLTLLRWVIGLESSPRGRRPAVRSAAVDAARGHAPITAGPVASAPAPRRRAAPASPAVRATMARDRAAELPASRAVRARSGYRQNQIAEAQRAINDVRRQLGS